ncbi:hypothetical protein [Halorhodospira halochloris]|uniref:hypothetical protein n=1 Tax=Halorhodospira halochloris TaxID=1052 RepID=UPI001EE8C283|nr:hypothetical protein [Halorhodospira halochloris]MCG5549490.1 hypothetical protein [Halorhodospira halochloris]
MDPITQNFIVERANDSVRIGVIDLDSIYKARYLVRLFWRRRTEKFLFRLIIVLHETYGNPGERPYRAFLEGLRSAGAEHIGWSVRKMKAVRLVVKSRWLGEMDSD